MIRIALPLLALATAACIPPGEPQAPPAPPPAAEAGKCDAAPVQGYVGSHASGPVVEKIVAESGARSARVIRPGMAVTMDYREDRVNVRVDDEGRIASIACG
jgi:hypothetical protein